jgi:hypothetical protein
MTDSPRAGGSDAGVKGTRRPGCPVPLAPATKSWVRVT